MKVEQTCDDVASLQPVGICGLLYMPGERFASNHYGRIYHVCSLMNSLGLGICAPKKYDYIYSAK